MDHFTLPYAPPLFLALSLLVGVLVPLGVWLRERRVRQRADRLRVEEPCADRKLVVD